MKRLLTVIVVLTLVSPVVAQTEETAPAPTTASSVDLLDDLWMFQDAVPVPAGEVDLRFSFGWQSALKPGGTGDTFQLTPALYWGVVENFELNAKVPIWVGDGGDRYVFDEGNYDSYVGVVWRVAEQADGGMFDIALAGNFRIPTGKKSNGVDYEARLALTHSYDSGVRSHFILWGEVLNGDINKTLRDKAAGAVTAVDVFNFFENYDDERDFQWGGTIGVDYPLCADGAVRLIFDYSYRTSIIEGNNGWHMAEVGWEWDITEADKFGMSFSGSIDRAANAPKAAAVVTYARALTF